MNLRLFPLTYHGPLHIPKDQRHPTTERTEQKAKPKERREKYITGSREDPN